MKKVKIMSIFVSQLFIYPIKSLPGLSVNALRLDALGAANDRRYMLVDDNGLFVTQRQFSQLVFARVEEIETNVEAWQITLPQLGSKTLPKQGVTDNSRAVTVWNDSILAYDQGDEWAQWFSLFLQKSVRLVFTDSSTTRLIDMHYCKEERQVSFTDGFPLLLTNESSLTHLNSYLDSAITMPRFRPNIVITGAEAFAEDGWKKLVSADLKLHLVKPCSRCVIPTINLQTGQKEKNVWDVLDKFCRREDNKIYFGQNVIHSKMGVLAVGDRFEIS